MNLFSVNKQVVATLKDINKQAGYISKLIVKCFGQTNTPMHVTEEDFDGH